MFEFIRGKLISIMGQMGFVETIILSYDYYETLTEDEIEEIETYMPSDQEHKWVILKRESGFISFLYRSPPRK